MNLHRARALVAGLFVMLAACGGGGSGGGGSSGAGSSPAPLPDEPSFEVLEPPKVYGYSSDWLMLRTMSQAAYPLALGQWAVDIAQRMSHGGAARTLQTPCTTFGASPAGQLGVTLDDRDTDGRVSVGDALLVTMQDCAAPVLFARADGSFRIEVQSGTSAALDRAVVLRILAQGDLALRGEDGDVSPATLTGALNVVWSEDETTQSLRVTTSGAEELLFMSLRGPNNLLPDRVRRLDVSRRTDFAAAETRAEMALITDVNDGGGTLVLSTTQTLKASLTGPLTAGQVRLQGKGGHVLADVNGRGFTHRLIDTSLGLEILAGPVNTSVTDHALAWNGHAQLADETRPAGGVPAWLEYDPTSFPCLQGGPCALAGYDPERLFLHPVLPQPGIVSAQATFRVQIGVAVADTQPTLNFEFSDCNPEGHDSAYWNVPARATRQGAFYTVQPLERLRQGRRYALVARGEGDPLAPALVRLADGSTGILGLSSTCIGTPADLLVELRSDAPAVTGPDAPTTVRSQVTTARGQAVAGFRWDQLSGAPVVLGTPQEATTTVAYADGAPRLLGDVLLQLTVNDTLGNEQRTRLQLRVGDHVDSGALSYAARRLADGTLQPDLARSGAPEAWDWGPGVTHGGLFFPGLGVLDFATGSAAALAVGRYDGALPPQVPGSHPSIGTAMYPDDCLGTMSAWFEVLELERDATGAPTRLSLDFELTCDQPRLPNIGTRLIGSYRYNSALPMRR